MIEKVKQALQSIVNRFEAGDIPEAIAYSPFPIPNIPAAKWSLPLYTPLFCVWQDLSPGSISDIPLLGLGEEGLGVMGCAEPPTTLSGLLLRFLTFRFAFCGRSTSASQFYPISRPLRRSAGMKATGEMLSSLARRVFVRVIELPSLGDQPDRLKEEERANLLRSI